VPSHNRRGSRLTQIPGLPPSLIHLPMGCAFHPRCARASAQCREEPEERPVDGRRLRCFHPLQQVVS
jgi:peptide/nickel transport system ATP-binding protein